MSSVLKTLAKIGSGSSDKDKDICNDLSNISVSSKDDKEEKNCSSKCGGKKHSMAETTSECPKILSKMASVPAAMPKSIGVTNLLGSHILITGAESGIGFGMVEHLSKQFDIHRIFACCYNEKQSKELVSLAENNPKITVIEMDLLRDSSIQNAVEVVKNALGDDPLHLLINNAVIFEKAECTYNAPRRDMILKHLEVNTVGTLFVTSAFLPLLQKAGKLLEPARVVNVSSALASISNNFGTMPWTDRNVAYGMSLAALNHLSRSIAGDERDSNVVFLNISPGWMKLSVVAPDSQSPMEEAAVGVLKTIALTSRADTGRFIDRNGTPINY